MAINHPSALLSLRPVSFGMTYFHLHLSQVFSTFPVTFWTHWLCKHVLLNLHTFVSFPFFLLLLISSALESDFV